MKVQTLQRRVLYQSVNVSEQEKTLQQSGKLYDALKEVVEKLPSHKVKERLSATQRALTARTKKLKALAAEIRIKELDSKSKDCTLEQLKQALLETKKELVKEVRLLRWSCCRVQLDGARFMMAIIFLSLFAPVVETREN